MYDAIIIDAGPQTAAQWNNYFHGFLDISDAICYTTQHAGELFGVEKVKPDPLNLLVKTDVGSIQTASL